MRIGPPEKSLGHIIGLQHGHASCWLLVDHVNGNTSQHNYTHLFTYSMRPNQCRENCACTLGKASHCTLSNARFYVYFFSSACPPLKVIKHMRPSVQTKLAYIIRAGRNTAVPLPIKPVPEKTAV
jgi:hypothetical protein